MWYIHGFAKNFAALRKKHKRWGKKSAPKVEVDAAVGLELSRYLDASQTFLRQCISISVAFDASRIGGKDVLLVAVLGSTGDKSLICWAPSQAGGDRVQNYGIPGVRHAMPGVRRAMLGARQAMPGIQQAK